MNKTCLNKLYISPLKPFKLRYCNKTDFDDILSKFTLKFQIIINEITDLQFFKSIYDLSD